jgi:hypothetical protein
MNAPIPRRALLLLPLLGMRSAWSSQAPAGSTQQRPPATTLMPSTPQTLRVDRQGFIRRWRVHEPTAVSGRLTQAEVEKVLLDAPYSRAPSPSHALDTTRYNFNLYHFAWALSKPTSNVLFWVRTIVDIPVDMALVRLAIGSNAASVWWLDDERLISLYNDRQSVIDDGVSRRLTLAKGRHEIRAAIINGGGATDFCARFLRDDGQPVTTLVSPPSPDA